MIPPAVVTSSVSTSMGEFKESATSSSKQHQSLSMTLKEIASDLDKLIKEIKTVKTKCQEQQQKLYKDRDSKKSNYLKAKLAYEDSVKKAETAYMSFQTGKTQSPNEKARKKLEEAANSALRELDVKHTTYVKAVRDYQQSQAKYDEDVHTMLLQLEDLERKRLVGVEQCLRKYETAHEALKLGADQTVDSLTKAVQSINVSHDVQTFIAENFTGNLPEQYCEYQPKISQIVGHFADTSAVQDSAAQLSEQTRTNAVRYPTAFAAAAHGNGQRPLNAPLTDFTGNSASGSAAGAAGAGAAPGPAAGGAAFGSVGGAPAAGNSAGGQKYIGTAVALYDYSSEEPGDLNFTAETQIQLLTAEPNDEWWTGSANGATGAFPRDYVKRVDDAPGSAVPAAVSAPACVSASADASERRVRALYEFQGEQADELSFKAGAVLTVISEQGEWLEGRDAEGKTGIFPTSYVEAI